MGAGRCGTTLDDAAGEAFDKVAKMIGLPYPGGPHVDRLAQEGNPDAFAFAAPRMENLDFSFSGLKTSVLRTLEKDSGDAMQRDGWRADVCASLQRTIVTMLVSRLEEAADVHGRTAIAIQGGVSANSGLRNAVEDLGERRGWSVHIPPFKYCTDNGAMIAMAGQFSAMKGQEGDLSDGPLPPVADGIGSGLNQGHRPCKVIGQKRPIAPGPRFGHPAVVSRGDTDVVQDQGRLPCFIPGHAHVHGREVSSWKLLVCPGQHNALVLDKVQEVPGVVLVAERKRLLHAVESRRPFQ